MEIKKNYKSVAVAFLNYLKTWQGMSSYKLNNQNNKLC